MRSHRGFALLLVLLGTAVLTLMGLSLTFSTMGEFVMSNEFEHHEKAFLVADAGFNAVKNSLRGTPINAFLAAPTSVPKYVEYQDPAVHSFAYRNPIPPLEARSIDFENPPPATSQRTAYGFLTPPSGVLFGGGRYFAVVTDNRDEEPLDLLDNPYSDMDGSIYVRVLGLYRNLPSDRSSYGGNVKNSVAIIEAMIRRDTSFDIGSPFAVYGPDVNPASSNLFDGNSFLIDGFDHSEWSRDDITRPHAHPPGSGQAAIGVIYNDPLGGDGSTAVNTIYNSLNTQQHNNLVGAPGPYGPYPSLQDDTNDIRISTNPDAANIFDANFMANFINKVSSVADYRYPGGTTLSGTNIVLGTESSPKITLAKGDLTISGNGSGAGVLIVKGTLNYQGAFDYTGVILVVGDGEAIFGGANKALIGGLYISKLVKDDDDDNYSFGIPSFSLAGNSKFYFKSQSVRMGGSLLPMKTLLWREITPEIEPSS